VPKQYIKKFSQNTQNKQLKSEVQKNDFAEQKIFYLNCMLTKGEEYGPLYSDGDSTYS